jgi:hypothetical protein
MGLFKRKEPKLPEVAITLKAAIQAAAEAAKATDCELEVHIDYEN